MAHKTLIGGTAYEVTGGRTLISGTGYEVTGGRTLIGGTGYDIPFKNELIVYNSGSSVLQGTLTVGHYRHATGSVSSPVVQAGGIVDNTIKVSNATALVPGYGAGYNIYYVTIGPIDVTKYTQLHAEGYASDLLVINSFTIGTHFGLSSSAASDSVQNPTYEISGNIASTELCEVVLDISSYSGTYYIQLNIPVHTGTRYGYYSKIWLT